MAPRLRPALLTCVVVLAWLAWLAPAGLALAGPQEGRARELFHRGQVAFEAGRFAEAAHQFEDAYALSRRPALLWNIGRAYQSLFDVNHNPADLRQARAVFLNYSELARTGPERDDAVKQLATIDQKLAEADAQEGSERERLNQELLQQQRLLKQQQAPPRPNGVEPTQPAPTTPATTATTAPATPGPTEVAPVAVAPAPLAAPAPVSRPRPSLVAPVTVLVLTLALAGTGAGLYLTAQSDYNAVVPGCTPRCPPAQFDPIANRFYASYGLLGAAGAAAIVDVALWAWRAARLGDRAAAAARPRVVVLPSPTGLVVGGQF